MAEGVRLIDGPLRPDPDAKPPPSSGAVLSFQGRVRDHHAGRAVTGIHYHAYRPLAEARLAELEAAAIHRFGLDRCQIWHSVGALRVGDISVVVDCSAAHRDAAYAASRWLIDTLKATVPIWKQEHYADHPAAFQAGTPIQDLPS